MEHDPIVVDIETVGIPNAADYLEPVKPDGRLTDPAKIAADIEHKTRERNEKLALDWNVGRIAAIGWWTEHGMCYGVLKTEDDERRELDTFWRASRNRSIVGYNIKGFDLRFLVRRSQLLGVDYPILDFGKYSKKGIVDLYLELTFGDGHYDAGCMKRSLKAFCKRFGIPCNDPIDGKDIPALVAAGEWGKVESHVRSDIAMTVALARKLRVIRHEVEEPVL